MADSDSDIQAIGGDYTTFQPWLDAKGSETGTHTAWVADEVIVDDAFFNQPTAAASAFIVKPQSIAQGHSADAKHDGRSRNVSGFGATIEKTGFNILFYWYDSNGATLLIEDMVFQRASSSGDSQHVFIRGGAGTATIRRCVFEKSSGTATGSGVDIRENGCVVSDNIIYGYSTFGIDARNATTSCEITGNTCVGGSLCILPPTGTGAGIVVSNNIAVQASSEDFYQSSTNTNHGSNIASDATAVSEWDGAGGSVNSVQVLETGDTPTADYVAFANLTAGSEDFHLVDLEDGTYNNVALAGGISGYGSGTDIDGDTRDATTPDIGADELVATVTYPVFGNAFPTSMSIAFPTGAVVPDTKVTQLSPTATPGRRYTFAAKDPATGTVYPITGLADLGTISASATVTLDAATVYPITGLADLGTFSGSATVTLDAATVYPVTGLSDLGTFSASATVTLDAATVYPVTGLSDLGTFSGSATVSKDVLGEYPITGLADLGTFSGSVVVSKVGVSTYPVTGLADLGTLSSGGSVSISIPGEYSITGLADLGTLSSSGTFTLVGVSTYPITGLADLGTISSGATVTLDQVSTYPITSSADLGTFSGFATVALEGQVLYPITGLADLGTISATGSFAVVGVSTYPVTGLADIGTFTGSAEVTIPQPGVFPVVGNANLGTISASANVSKIGVSPPYPVSGTSLLGVFDADANVIWTDSTAYEVTGVASIGSVSGSLETIIVSVSGPYPVTGLADIGTVSAEATVEIALLGNYPIVGEALIGRFITSWARPELVSQEQISVTSVNRLVVVGPAGRVGRALQAGKINRTLSV